MPHVCPRREFLTRSVALAAPLLQVGCGTILYPERRGQAAGCLDWKVVALDAVGLVCFFVPGVIAFAVDFNNGTIYLPPEECAAKRRSAGDEFTQVPVTGNRYDVAAIEDAVSAETQKTVRLEPGQYQTRPLSSLREFWGVRAWFRGDV